MPTAKPQASMPAPTRVERQNEASALEQARASRPRNTAKNAPRPAVFTPENSVVFRPTDGVDTLILKVGFRPAGASDKDDELTEAAITALGDRRIYFRNGMYLSTIPAITAWLRHRLKTGVATSYYEYVPQPKAFRQGDETVLLDANGNRLMTYDEALALHQQLNPQATTDAPAPTVSDEPIAFANGVDDFSLAKPEEDAKHRAHNARSRVSGAMKKGTN